MKKPQIQKLTQMRKRRLRLRLRKRSLNFQMKSLIWITVLTCANTPVPKNVVLKLKSNS